MPPKSNHSQGLRLMAVHAHPDDESSKGAATMARYIDEGAEVLVVTCTGGERGDIQNPRLEPQREEIMADITAVRRKEMAAAVEILGVKHTWLGFVDSGYPDGLEENNPAALPSGCFARESVDDAAKPLIALMREFRPHVVTTYDENGGYPHPDHIMTHLITRAAYCKAGSSAYDNGREPWQPLKVYYNSAFTKERVIVLHETLIEQGKESPFERMLQLMERRPDRPIHARIEVADYLHKREEALLAHATQVDPDGLFFAVPTEQLKTLWPSEDFERGHSYVSASKMEDDLFEGIRGTQLVERGGPLDTPATGFCE